MGRSSYKQEADYLKKMSTSFLKENGYFKASWKSGIVTWSINGEKTGSISIESCIDDFQQYIRFIYTRTDNYSGEKKDFSYKVELTTTPCYFGGKRYWFICPLSKNGIYCGRRVGVLYLGGDYFGCRHCYELTYESRKSRYGATITDQELEELENKTKRKFYKGKMTRKYKAFLKKRKKSYEQIISLYRQLLK